MNNQKNNTYQKLSILTSQEFIKQQQINLDGLSKTQVENSMKQYGKNEINYDHANSLLKDIIKNFFTPFTIVLLVLAIISFFTDYVYVDANSRDLTAVIIIVVMVLLSGGLSFYQTRRSNNAASKLKSLVNITTNVKRKDQDAKELAMDQVVTHDIIYLGAGDMIPADMRIVQAKDLFISQSALTGESAPVEKIAEAYQIQENDNVYDYQNFVFMGSNVISGSATCVVTNVGSNTYFGNLATSLSEDKPETNFDRGIKSVSYLLIKFMAIMVPIVFVINGLFKGDWLNSLLFALSIAVGLTPEMLPMIVTTNLSKGSMEMAKEGTIIKNLNSVQSFGAIDVLCTDKTGTLTQDKIVLEYHWNLNGQDDDYVLKMAYFNSYYQTGLKNLMDEAIITSANKYLNLNETNNNYVKVDEIPFDFDRRRMSVVIQDQKQKTTLITKGAIEELLAISTTAYINGQVIPLTKEVEDNIYQVVDQLGSQGFRVIGLATKNNPPKAQEFSIKDENEMTLTGVLAFLDPPKDSAKAAIQALVEHGVRVKVITGDNELVTKRVCEQVNLNADKIYYGSDVEQLELKQLQKITNEYDIFVKCSPAQKTKIVHAIKSNNHVVGYMGDGINDALALKEADVGISVDTAVDIAKESADVILLDKDLMVLEKGIVNGRKIFANTIKYIKMTASSNFGNMFSVLAATIFLPFLPMLPLQILLLNLIYDISCISMPWDNVDDEYVKQPKKWDASSIKNFMIWFGPTSSIFDIITYLVLYFVICPLVVGGSFHTLDNNQQLIFMALFHTGWFIESLWSQTAIIHVLRSDKIPFIQTKASLIVSVVTTLGIIFGTYLAYSPISEDIDMYPLPNYYFIFLIIVMITYFILTSIVKHFYLKKYQQLL